MVLEFHKKISNKFDELGALILSLSRFSVRKNGFEGKLRV